MLDTTPNQSICQVFARDGHIGNTFNVFSVNCIGVEYPSAWWGLTKLYSINHSVSKRLNSAQSGVKLPRSMNSCCKVWLNFSQTGLSVGVCGLERYWVMSSSFSCCSNS